MMTHTYMYIVYVYMLLVFYCFRKLLCNIRNLLFFINTKKKL